MVRVQVLESAYETLLLHMLQFGNKSLKKTNEVSGLIFGIRSGDLITIKKVVPIKHGPDCEKAFTETDFVTFSEIESKIIKEESLESFGFYTSHPKMGYYLSQNEIKNLLYFMQEKKNPFAIALIGDHAQMEQRDDFGIQAFQLKDISKGVNSDFIKIELEIESPQNMNVFKITKFLIEQGQKRQPYIEEQGTQLKADENLWDNAFSDSETPEQKAEKKIVPILTTLQSEVQNINDCFISALLKTYNEYLENMNQFISKAFNDPSSDLIGLRENVDFGMMNVNSWFSTTFKRHSEKVIDEYKRTYSTIQENQQENLKALKILLISQIIEYERIIKMLS